jgi:Ca-activated chloride channel family protein
MRLMLRMRGPSALVLVAVVLTGWTLQAAAGQRVFRASADLVSLPVIVSGRGDTLLTDLTRDQFAVFEDGRRQEVRYFAVGSTPDLPLHLGLLLDTSGSMEKDLGAAGTAAIKFVNTLTEARDTTLVEFASHVRVSRYEPQSYPRLFERIRTPEADGYTALYDALAMYLTAAEDQDGQKVLLLYTDGGDSRSTTSYGALVEMLRLSQVQIYVVGYLEHQPSSERALQQMRLNDVAKQTGGQAFYQTRKEDLEKFYARILEEIASRYTLGYVSDNPARDGKFRKVEVKVTVPGVSGLKVRTRPGYYAPAR